MKNAKPKIKILKSKDAGNMEVYVTFSVSINTKTESFLKRINGSLYHSEGLNDVLLSDPKVKLFLAND